MTHGTGGTGLPGSGWKNAGSTVSISATPTNNTQVSYHFEAWSGTGAGSYSGTNNPASITLNSPITENRFLYSGPVRVTVQTSPAGLTFSVDGTTYTSAQIFSWQPGSSHTIATTSPQDGGTGVRYVWSNWSGGGAISHTVAPTTNRTYTANFNTQYCLTMSHGTGGTVSPASGMERQRRSRFDQCHADKRLQLHELEWERNRLVFRDEQSGFNYNERTNQGDGDFHS
jgi:hypothetical protein